ncbi:MAG: hypothetical protein DWQ37_18610 [Planctomycetota bacterium]|nr:MAG: hypothetical protein DWQ37_18610 [Planctomycetota bacterium]
MLYGARFRSRNKSPRRRKTASRLGWRPAAFAPEPLEDRRLLAVVNVNGDQDFANQPDTFIVLRDAGDPADVNIFRNGALFQTIALADLDQLNVNGLGGNDTLIVNATNGLLSIPGGIHYDGGDGFDDLQLVGGTGQSEVLAISAQPGAGRDTILGTGGEFPPSQVVDFENIEPVTSNAAVTSFQITSVVGIASLLQQANAINYVQSEVDGGLGVDATWGKVTVDNFEPIYFQNKTELVIDAGPGSDEINLNNPSTPTGLTDIVINGDDPTASDTLIVNGTAGDDEITYTPTGSDSGTVQVNALPAIAFGTTEHLTINGLGGNDTLTVDTLNLTGVQVLTPGSTFDSGHIEFQDNSADNFLGAPVSFLSLGTFGELRVVDTGGGTSDQFVYRGTDLSDSFAVSPIDATTVGIALNDQIDVRLSGVFELTLAGLNGNDQFFSGAIEALGRIRIDGGNPDGGSDSFDFVAPQDTTTTIDFDVFGVGTVISSSVPDTAVVVPNGVETVNLRGSDASLDTFVVENYGAVTDVLTLNLDAGDTETPGDDGDMITVNTTTGPDTIEYTPLSSFTARLERTQGGPQINIEDFNNTDGNLQVVNPGLVFGNVDSMHVIGSETDDEITVIEPTPGTQRVTVDVGGSVKWVPVDFAAFESLKVSGQLGDDELTVDNSTGLVTLNAGITFDGGGGVDLLRLTGSTEIDTAEYFVGPQPDAGRVVHEFDDGEVNRVQTVYFENLEPVIDIVVAVSLTVNANNADNAINYMEGPNSFQAPVAGFESGLVSVDDHETIEFARKGALFIEALAGSDTINLNNDRTPTGLNVINVQGGDATGQSTDGDVVIVNGTQMAQTIDVAFIGPMFPNNDSARITGAQPIEVNVDEIERLVIDGQTGGDDLTVRSAVNVLDVMTLTPGPSPDQGSVQSSFFGLSLLQVDYVDLGGQLVTPAEVPDPQTPTANTVTLGEANTVIYNGTAASDSFYVDNAGVVTLFSTHSFVSVVPVAANLRLNGLSGDDTFNVYAQQAFEQILLDGGSPSASDMVNLIGLAQNDEVFNVRFFAGTVPPSLPLIVGTPVPVTINGLGGTIGITGIEGVNIDGLDGTDTLTATGTVDDDLFTYTPTRVDDVADDGMFTNAGFNTVFTFNRIAGDVTLNGGGPLETGDEVIVNGTSGPDYIEVDSPNREVTVNDSAGIARKTVTLGETIEVVSVEALGGNDTILVTPAPALAVGPGGANGVDVPINLLVNVDGGIPGASDALVIAQADGSVLPATDFVVINRSRTPDEGVVRIYRTIQANDAPTALPDITYVDVEVVTPLLPPPANPTQDPNLMILGPDDYEQNEFLSTAAYLGSGSTINVTDLAIFPNGLEHRFVPADVDWYRVVAQKTGTMDFQVYFRTFAALGPGSIPGGGDLDLDAFDSQGNAITGFGTNDTDADERVRIPVVAGQTYYVRVSGATDDAFNGYDMTVVNEAPPTPWGLELYDVIVTGDVANGVSNTVFTSTSADLSEENDAYNGMYIHFKSGNANGLRGLIEDYAYNNVTNTATFTLAAPLAETPQQVGEPPVNVVPTAGSAFEIESNDTGRSQFDNVTRDDTPTIFLRLDDGILLNDLPGNDTPNSPPDEVIPIPFQDQNLAPGYRIAIFDEGNVPPQQSDPPQTPVGFATAVPGQIGVYAFTFTTPLSPGSHFITARVQMIDPAEAEETGFGPRSLPLEIVIDVQSAPIFFGLPFLENDGLDSASDTGVEGQPATFNDRITSDTTPTFYGTAEANAVVRVYVDLNGNGTVEPTDYLIGQTVASPIDGTNQFPGGRWVVESNVDLNNPNYFAKDGVRTILVTTEDPAGNQSPNNEDVERLDIFLDTQGPQITDVVIADRNGDDVTDFELFLLKPDNGPQGPTPLVWGLNIKVQDYPVLDALFPREAIQTAVNQNPGPINLPNPGVFVVKGDHNGVIEIESVQVIFDTSLPADEGLPARATIKLTFATPLPDDRFTLTVVDEGVVDPAGNELDGENNAIEPSGTPLFPTGDGQPGGTFVARFTVDSRPEIGTYAAAQVFVDANGNFVQDFQGKDNDFTNRDLVFALGIAPGIANSFSPMGIHDGVFAGNFIKNGNADGYDKLAAYGPDPKAGGFRWLIDTNFDGVIKLADGDIAQAQPANAQINGLPIAGNFDGNAANGDEIGLFDGVTWYFDLNHDFIISAGEGATSTALRGTPIVGDFNGDGNVDIGTWRNNQFDFIFGSGGASFGSNIQATINWGLPGVSEKPIAADMDQDGITDIGLYIPGRDGVLPLESGEWYFLLSNDFDEEQRGGNQVNALNHPFSPTPLGTDIQAQWGDGFALPLVGNFDPPATSSSLPAPNQIGPLLGTTSVNSSVAGQSWYAFQPLRDGTVSVQATSANGSVDVNLYDDGYSLMNGVSPLNAGQSAATASVVAGKTYLVRLTGSATSADLKITNTLSTADRYDVTRDGRVAANDALELINHLLIVGQHLTPMSMANAQMYLDTNVDGKITAGDAIDVINHLLTMPSDSKFSPQATPAAATATDFAEAAVTSMADAPIVTGSAAVAIGLAAASPTTVGLAPVAADAVYAEIEETETATHSEGPSPSQALTEKNTSELKLTDTDISELDLFGEEWDLLA